MFKPLTPAQFELELADAKIQAKYRNNMNPTYTDPDGNVHRIEYFVNTVKGRPALQWWCPPADSKNLDPEM